MTARTFIPTLGAVLSAGSRLPGRQCWLCVLAALLLMTGVEAADGATRVATGAAATAAAPVDADTLPIGSASAVTVVRWISPHRYQLDVQNTSAIGYINSFSWIPPTEMTVVAVTSSQGGRCSMTGGGIRCSGKLAPPACTCRPGGELTANFTANGLEPTFADGHWTYYGVVGSRFHIETVTPVSKHIPSSQGTRAVPPCNKGQTSTRTHPCLGV